MEASGAWTMPFGSIVNAREELALLIMGLDWQPGHVQLVGKKSLFQAMIRKQARREEKFK